MIRIANYSAVPFRGWIRATTDFEVEPAAGTLAGGTRYVRGRRIGDDLWTLDLLVDLAPGEQRAVPLDDVGTAPPPAPSMQLPDDPAAHFGGPVTVNGVALQIVSLVPDASAWHLHARARIGRMLVADVWLDWRASEPHFAIGEVLITASDPSVPDLHVTVPSDGIRLAFGDALVHVVGAGWQAPVVPGGTVFADGQARAVPVVCFWPRHAKSPDAWVQAAVAAAGSVGALGVDSLWQGVPPRASAPLPPQLWGPAHDRLHTWQAPLLGPNPNSADTGSQNDQGFPGGDADGPAGARVYYLSALKVAARPCHHRGADGAPLTATQTSGIQWWCGRPHPSTGNLLGKAATIGPDDASGWSGPDREHWFYNVLVAGFRFTGSPACQFLLEEQARLFLRSETVTPPGWFTSGPDTARAVGWAMLLAVQLYDNLANRDLAEAVRQRALERIDLVYRPKLGAGELWDIRVDDPRLGDGPWWMPWQQAVGAYGLFCAADRFGSAVGKGIAVVAARAVLVRAWVKVGGRWQTRAQMPVAGGGPSDESFNYFGMPLAVATMLRHTPDDALARDIWNQLTQTTRADQLRWLPPEVQ